MFENLKTDTSIKAEKDSIGGFTVLESGLYDMTIELAYIDKSPGGAMSLVLHMKDKFGQQLRSIQWMTSKESKQCKNYYEDRNGDKQYLPGFLVANSLCLLTVGKEISAMSAEDKVINVYDFSQGKEVPTSKPVLMELLGKTATLGVLKVTVNKSVKGASGEWVDTKDTQNINEINKVFRASDGLTVNEITAGTTEATFKQKWSDKNTGNTVNKVKDVAPNLAAVNTAGGAAPQAAESLFGQG